MIQLAEFNLFLVWLLEILSSLFCNDTDSCDASFSLKVTIKSFFCD